MDALFLLLCTALASLAFQDQPSLAFTYPGRTLQSDTTTCSSSDQQEMIRDEIDEDLQTILQHVVVPIELPCGGGGWRLAAYLNITNPLQSCPSGWREYAQNGKRACGLPVGTTENCIQTFYQTGDVRYNNVCGRISGYQYRGPEAFPNAQGTIDENYVDGVSVTHGSFRQHIWTFAGGFRQDGRCNLCACSCDQDSVSAAVVPPFVGENYFCESGVMSFNGSSILYTDNPLWDGQGCGPTSTCCSFHSPPWFNVQLSNTTSDDIEVRLCGSAFENTPIETMKIYVK